MLMWADRVFLNKCEFLRFPWGEPFVQRYFHIEAREVDVPTRNQRVQKRNAVFVRNIEDVCIEEFQMMTRICSWLLSPS